MATPVKVKVDTGTSTHPLAVIVTNTVGDVLNRTDLGSGSVDDSTCLFEFEFEITEGEDDYIVAVGDRGETSNTFEELDSLGVNLTLGG